MKTKPVKTKKKLNPNLIRLFRKVQKFLIEEPLRFDMRDGIEVFPVFEPRGGTVCCIAGAGYAIHNKLVLNYSRVSFDKIEKMFAEEFKMTQQQMDRLFYTNLVCGRGWPHFYEKAYYVAPTALERACIGVARIEHFIATDGEE